MPRDNDLKFKITADVRQALSEAKSLEKRFMKLEGNYKKLQKRFGKDIKLRAKPVKSQLTSITREVKKTGNAFSELGRKLRVIGTLGGAAVAYLSLKRLATVATQTTSAVLKLGFALEDLRTSLQVITRSDALGQQKLRDLVQFAKETPFEALKIARAAKQLIAFGIPLADLNDTLRRLGDIAGAVGAPIEDLTRIYGQVRAENRLTARRFKQLNIRAANLGEEISKGLNIPLSKLRDEMEAGNVTFDVFKQAVIDATNAGGRFEGGALRLSKNLSIAFQNVGDVTKDLVGNMVLIAARAVDLHDKLTSLANVVGRIADGFALWESQQKEIATPFEDVIKDAEKLLKLENAQEEQLRSLSKRLSGYLLLQKQRYDEAKKITEIPNVDRFAGTSLSPISTERLTEAQRIVQEYEKYVHIIEQLNERATQAVKTGINQGFGGKQEGPREADIVANQANEFREQILAFTDAETLSANLFRLATENVEKFGTVSKEVFTANQTLLEKRLRLLKEIADTDTSTEEGQLYRDSLMLQLDALNDFHVKSVEASRDSENRRLSDAAFASGQYLKLLEDEGKKAKQIYEDTGKAKTKQIKDQQKIELKSLKETAAIEKKHLKSLRVFENDINKKIAAARLADDEEKLSILQEEKDKTIELINDTKDQRLKAIEDARVAQQEATDRGDKAEKLRIESSLVQTLSNIDTEFEARKKIITDTSELQKEALAEEKRLRQENLKLAQQSISSVGQSVSDSTPEPLIRLTAKHVAESVGGNIGAAITDVLGLGLIDIGKSVIDVFKQAANEAKKAQAESNKQQTELFNRLLTEAGKEVDADFAKGQRLASLQEQFPFITKAEAAEFLDKQDKLAESNKELTDQLKETTGELHLELTNAFTRALTDYRLVSGKFERRGFSFSNIHREYGTHADGREAVVSSLFRFGEEAGKTADQMAKARTQLEENYDKLEERLGAANVRGALAAGDETVIKELVDGVDFIGDEAVEIGEKVTEGNKISAEQLKALNDSRAFLQNLGKATGKFAGNLAVAMARNTEAIVSGDGEVLISLNDLQSAIFSYTRDLGDQFSEKIQKSFPNFFTGEDQGFLASTLASAMGPVFGAVAGGLFSGIVGLFGKSDEERRREEARRRREERRRTCEELLAMRNQTVREVAFLLGETLDRSNQPIQVHIDNKLSLDGRELTESVSRQVANGYILGEGV